MNTPLVSVSLVTYNHERYIADSIRSMLNQSMPDLEVIVVDDGSTDRTFEVASSISDPRLRLIRQRNAGPSSATNRAISEARGQYVALMSGDDLSKPQRLEHQLAAARATEPGLHFSGCDFIDDGGRPMRGDHPLAGAFDLRSRTRAQFFHELFKGNFLNGVTTFAERRLFQDLGPFDASMIQLQDYDMWVRAVKRFTIYVSPESLVDYRCRTGAGNLSSVTTSRAVRIDNEHHLIRRRFFDGASHDLIREAFECVFVRPDLTTPEATRCELALLFLRVGLPETVRIAIDELHELFQSPATAALLENELSFPRQEYLDLLGNFDPVGRYQQATTKLYLDTGHGFNENEKITQFTRRPGEFRLRFDLSGQPPVKALRWDPIENRLLRLTLTRVAWIDGNGSEHELDLENRVSANGPRDARGEIVFPDVDPVVFFGISGQVADVTIEGRWLIFDEIGSIQGAHQTLVAARRESDSLREQLHQMEANHSAALALSEERLGLLSRTWDRRLRRRLSRLPAPVRRLLKWFDLSRMS